MRKITRFAAPALVAALGISAIAPASAHESPRHYGGRYTPVRNDAVRSDINGLRRDIDRAAARRAISEREARGLRRDAADIQRLYASYARNGLTRWEVQNLQRKVDRVHVALHMERRDHDRRRG
ncbi:MAG TPA: hypothetical protein VJQ77_08620 [Novosphingobium sp.]|nr:hypothetical protein [Novosphingobium sp.]